MSKSRDILVLADSIRSLYNVGSLFRLCDGVGVKKLYLCGTTGAPHDRVKYARQRQQIAKTALEGLSAVEWEYREDILATIKELQQRGIQVIAIEQAETSVSYTDFNYGDQVCVVLGNEVDGVSTEVLQAVDAIVELPMLGQGKSLNVISAASAVLYHIRTQKTDR